MPSYVFTINNFRFVLHAEKLADEGESELCVNILEILQDILERKEISTERVCT